LNHSWHIIWYQSINCNLRQDPKIEERLARIKVDKLNMVGDKEDLPRGLSLEQAQVMGLQ
jgi:hypothetical protein